MAHYDDGQVTFLLGDVRDVLREMPAESVNMCVTSPPYYGLRDYGTATWEGGDDACEHKGEPLRTMAQVNEHTNGANSIKVPNQFYRDICGKCGAKRIDQQLGLERTPEEYVAKMVDVFREVRRVLRPDGTLWLNIGDSYAAARGGTYQPAETLAGGQHGKTTDGENVNRGRADGYSPSRNASAIGLKHKDLVGIPWMLAFALRADGWYLRQDIIWAKPNPMPESVRDRCTKAHEYLFLLSKSERYYYDADAIKEASIYPDDNRKGRQQQDAYDSQMGDGARLRAVINPLNAKTYPERNKRSVWTIATAPYTEAHFATFPPALVEPCILAGCPEGGTVLDPFIGSGTTALVARRLGRRAIGIDLNAEYLDMAVRRAGGQLAMEMTR